MNVYPLFFSFDGTGWWVSVFGSVLILHHYFPVLFPNSFLFWICALFSWHSAPCSFLTRCLPVLLLFSPSLPSFNGVSLFCTLQLAKQKGMLNWFWVSVFSSFLILHYTLPVSFLNSCPFWVCALFLAIQALTSPSSIFSFPFGFSPLLAIRIWSLLFDFGSLNLVLMVNIEW